VQWNKGPCFYYPISRGGGPEGQGMVSWSCYDVVKAIGAKAGSKCKLSFTIPCWLITTTFTLHRWPQIRCFVRIIDYDDGLWVCEIICVSEVIIDNECLKLNYYMNATQMVELW